MSPIALPSDVGLRVQSDPPVDASHPPAGVLARTRSDLILRGLPWLTLAATVLFGLFNRDLTQMRDTVPFLVSFVFFGMPHGAMDLVVNQRLRRLEGRTTGLRGFAWYLGLMAFAGIVLVTAPIVAVIAFFVLTVVHWGRGDLEATGGAPPHRLDRSAAIAGRGLLILGTAFAFDPAASWRPFSLLVSGEAAGSTSIDIARTIGLVAFGFGLVSSVFWVVRRWSSADRSGAILDTIESILIVAAIALTDPLFGIGMYFLGTHSFRHSVRLATIPSVISADSRTTSLARRLTIVHLLSIPLLIPTFILLLGWSRIQFGGLDAMALTVTMLGFFLVTTLPHHMLGCRLPRSQVV